MQNLSNLNNFYFKMLHFELKTAAFIFNHLFCI